MSVRNSTSNPHISNQELAFRWGIPHSAVSEVKERFALNGIYPLTDEIITVSTSFDTFLEEAAAIADEFLAKNAQRLEAQAKKDQEFGRVFMTQAEVMKTLDISRPQLEFAKRKGMLIKRGGESFRRDRIERINVADFKDSLTSLMASQHKRSSANSASVRDVKSIDERKKEIYSNVHINVRDRNSTPLSTTFYYGPTNSGKTYQALENLFSEYELDPEGLYVYAGPLRMLAFEVYQKMVARYGEEAVGFITGEENINPEARLLAVTTEMAPREGSSIVLDEAHWIADESRGDHWTQLLVGGRYDFFHIAAAAEAGETLEELMSDSYQIFKNTYKRRTDISYEGGIFLEDIPAKTAVVCFTKKTVYAMAKELTLRGHKVGVLYGALPIATRKQQIDLFIAGEYDIIVTTDVIGHGINLPIDNVVFAQTEKFDGVQKRELRRWETAQIAGRAGRFGLSEKGRVYVAKGIKWLNANETTVSEGTLCAAGRLPADLHIKEAVLAPRLIDLGLGDDDQIWLSYALFAWREKAVNALAGKNIRPATLRDTDENLGFLANYLKYYLNPWESHGSVTYIDGKPVQDARRRSYKWELAMEDLWSLVTGPFDSKMGVVPILATWLTQEGKERSPIVRSFFDEIERTKTTDIVDILETSVKRISELKMAAVIFGKDNRLGALKVSRLEPVEQAMVERINSLLQDSIEASSHGQCSHCGKSVEPRYEKCLPCSSFESQKSRKGSSAQKSAKNSSGLVFRKPEKKYGKAKMRIA